MFKSNKHGDFFYPNQRLEITVNDCVGINDFKHMSLILENTSAMLE